MNRVSAYHAELARQWIFFYRREFGITLAEVLIPEPEPAFEGK